MHLLHKCPAAPLASLELVAALNAINSALSKILFHFSPTYTSYTNRESRPRAGAQN